MGTREEAKGPTSTPPQLVEWMFTGPKEDFANIIKRCFCTGQKGVFQD